MAYQIEWTERAIADLEGILDYLNRTSEDASQRLGEAIFVSR